MQASSLKRYLKRVTVPVAVILSASLLFALRYSAALRMPNFYAEDATIFFNNIYTQHPVQALLEPFNGYFVVGQYLLGFIAAAVNVPFGNDIVDLPLVMAIVSILFLGITASLPYLLFKRELGVKLSLLAVLFTALVPLYSSDYAIIGTLGNLKFAFLYIAFLLILWRWKNRKIATFTKIIATDLALLICVLTNVTVVLLLPFLLLDRMTVTRKGVRLEKNIVDAPLISALVLVGISGVYVLGALLRGIPEMPGYLDGPFLVESILPLIERTLFFAWIYPITSTMSPLLISYLMMVLLLGISIHVNRNRTELPFVVFAAWAIFIGTALFVFNRPGISAYYLTFGHKGGADQFFYAQNMIVIFATFWLLKSRINNWFSKHRIAVTGVVVGYLIWAVPFGTSFGSSEAVVSYLKPIKPNIEKACREYSHLNTVVVQIYPSPDWQWHVSKELACDY